MARRNRLRPLDARRALLALIDNPDDTGQAFKVVAAMSGDASTRLLRRFQKTDTGRKLLRERPDLFDALRDTSKLREMPEGSLGRGIAEYFDNEELSAQGLADASQAGFGDGPPEDEEIPEELVFLMTRLRDQHDVFHVMTGYGRDVRGELAVLAFTAMQTRNPGVAIIPLYLLWRSGLRSELGKIIRQGFRRGWNARWMVDAEWEKLLAQPLDELRDRFKVGPPPVYEQSRSAGAPPLPASA